MQNFLFIRCNDIAAYGDSEKSQSSSIEMKCVKVDGLHYKAPDGSVYASINKEKPGDANGAIDNANFATDTDGAYEPIGNDTPQKKVKDFEYNSGRGGYVVHDYSALLSASAESSSLDERLDSLSVISSSA